MMTRSAALLCIAALISADAVGQVWWENSSQGPDCSAAFNDGRGVGYNEGFNAGHLNGEASGQANMLAACQANPNGCGIYLGACLAAPQYGETEPNDNIVTADALLGDTKFWGQAYGMEDQDWFYVVTSEPNQNMTINFSVPTGSVSGWQIAVRDAAGNVFAQFDAGAVPGSTSPQGDISYRVTLGLVGTYYISLQPTALNYEPYNLAVVIQSSPLETQNFIAGFYDAELEPNDGPQSASPLATGVAMFGVINLNFEPGTEVPDPDGDGFQYSQGLDDDWYVYDSPGNEVLALEICGHAECTNGNWLFSLYDAAGAAQEASGNYATPLLAVNSDIGNNDRYVVGLGNPGPYYLRVTHKRLLTAPCAAYQTDWNNDGLPSGPPGSEATPQACGCESGYRCDLTVANPSRRVVEEATWPQCPYDFVSATEQCQATCECTGTGCALSSDPAVPCSCGGNATQCRVFVPNPGTPTVAETIEYGLCPDGSGGGTSPQCTIGCVCTQFSGVIEVPEGAVTSQYNFSVFGTNLPPSTVNSDAFPAFQGRPNPYTP